MLTTYLTDVRNLLQNPSADNPLYPDSSLTRWINIARGQLAGEAECIRYHATISTVIGQRAYDFSDLNTGISTGNGIAGTIHISSIHYLAGAGQKWITPRNWEWFSLYSLNSAVPTSGAPISWSQYGQGAASVAGGSSATGSFYLDPIPDAVYSLSCNCICYPVTLIDNTTIEAIPYLWTDAVPFFTAYYAYLASQVTARAADAERMFSYYQTFLERARKMSNPSVLRWQYSQASDPTQFNKIGLPKQAAGAGG